MEDLRQRSGIGSLSNCQALTDPKPSLPNLPTLMQIEEIQMAPSPHWQSGALLEPKQQPFNLGPWVRSQPVLYLWSFNFAAKVSLVVTAFDLSCMIRPIVVLCQGKHPGTECVGLVSKLVEPTNAPAQNFDASTWFSASAAQVQRWESQPYSGCAVENKRDASTTCATISRLLLVLMLYSKRAALIQSRVKSYEML